ncbi:MAG TPA: hypothetical protein VMD30_05840 [Tepidisphaeraceae bacterium]|nr:hypothetical protein [Tepidisphaeraceae bacterium]
MTVSTVRIGKREYVLLPRKDFDRLQRQAEQIREEEAEDVAESVRRLHDAKEKPISWEQVKRRAGLA